MRGGGSSVFRHDVPGALTGRDNAAFCSRFQKPERRCALAVSLRRSAVAAGGMRRSRTHDVAASPFDAAVRHASLHLRNYDEDRGRVKVSALNTGLGTSGQRTGTIRSMPSPTNS